MDHCKAVTQDATASRHTLPVKRKLPVTHHVNEYLGSMGSVRAQNLQCHHHI
jgi:hypothetical protein